jgi:hypothetical protein
MLEVLIGDDQQLEPVGFAALEKIAVANSSPPHFHCSRY